MWNFIKTLYQSYQIDKHTVPFYSEHFYFVGFTFEQSFLLQLKALRQPTFWINYQITSQMECRYVLESLGKPAMTSEVWNVLHIGLYKSNPLAVEGANINTSFIDRLLYIYE